MSNADRAANCNLREGDFVPLSDIEVRALTDRPLALRYRPRA
jgi:hypothetical protein